MKNIFLAIALFLTSFAYSQDEEAIRKPLNDYIEGTSYNQKEQVLRAFTDDAMLYLTNRDGNAWNITPEQYMGNFKEENRGKPTGRVGKILSIKQYQDVAFAEVQILVPAWNLDFMDLILLKKTNGEWKIISKTATKRECEEENCGVTLPSTKLKLTKAWETDTLLTNVESVVYDKAKQTIYTSNMNGNWKTKNGLATIGKLDLQGNIIDANWVSGLQGTTGITLHKGKLYIADFDKIEVVDIRKERIVKTITVEGTERLNDVDVLSNGIIYATESPQGKLFKIKNGKATLVEDGLADPNGLLLEDGNVILGLMGSNELVKKNCTTGEKQVLSEGEPKYADGIASDGRGGYFVSSFEGKVFHIAKNGDKQLILNVEPQGMQTADLTYIVEKNLLVIPSLNKSKVVAYEVEFE